MLKAKMHACMLSRFSQVCLFVTLWIVAHQTPLTMGFSRQEYWSGLPRPPLGDLPDPGIEPRSPESPALAGGFFTTSVTWETLKPKELVHFNNHIFLKNLKPRNCVHALHWQNRRPQPFSFLNLICFKIF